MKNKKTIFISYDHQDSNVIVKSLILKLKYVISDIWYDTIKLEPGDDFELKIFDGIHGCAVFLAFISKYSVKSEWVKKEIEYALDLKNQGHEIRIIPLIFDDTKIPEDLSRYKFIDFRKSLMGGVAELCKVLKIDVFLITIEEMEELISLVLSKSAKYDYSHFISPYSYSSERTKIAIIKKYWYRIFPAIIIFIVLIYLSLTGRNQPEVIQLVLLVSSVTIGAIELNRYSTIADYVNRYFELIKVFDDMDWDNLEVELKFENLLGKYDRRTFYKYELFKENAKYSIELCEKLYWKNGIFWGIIFLIAVAVSLITRFNYWQITSTTAAIAFIQCFMQHSNFDSDRNAIYRLFTRKNEFTTWKNIIFEKKNKYFEK